MAAGYKTGSHRVIDREHDDSHWRVEVLRRPHRGDRIHKDHARTSLGQLARQFRKPLIVSVCEASVEDIVLILDQAIFA